MIDIEGEVFARVAQKVRDQYPKIFITGEYAIASIVDEELLKLGFSRTMLNPIPNMEDATIYRMKGRYTAIVSKNHVIYRR